MKIAIITGGSGPERETSIKSAKYFKDQIDFGTVETFLYPEEYNDFLERKKEFDVAVPAIHGDDGEDGELQNDLEKHNIPYIFSDGDAHKICFHKENCKNIVSSELNIHTPKTYLIDDVDNIRFPLIAKPQECGSSIGVHFINNKSELEDLGFPEGYLYEEYIKGREFTVGVIEKNDEYIGLPIMEVIKKDKVIFDTHDKYSKVAESIEIFPLNLDLELEQKLKNIGLLVHKHLGLRHLSRTDIILSEDGKLYFLEVNTIPGCSDNSFIPKMVRADLDFGNLLKIWCKSVT